VWRLETGSGFILETGVTGSWLRRGAGHGDRDDVDFIEQLRDGGALVTVDAGVHGRDDEVLTIDDRFDDIVDALDGQMMGDNGDGISTPVRYGDF